MSATAMNIYNLVHGYNPNVRYTVLAGNYHPEDFWERFVVFLSSLGRGGDGAVSLDSALLLIIQVQRQALKLSKPVQPKMHSME